MSQKESKSIVEDANVVGGGAIAGTGIGPQGEPGVHPKNKLTVVLTDILRRRRQKV